MAEHRISMTSPARCPKCRVGHLLAFVIPHFEHEEFTPLKIHGPFSHYEVVYYCSRHVRFLSGGSCDYEAAIYVRGSDPCWQSALRGDENSGLHRRHDLERVTVESSILAVTLSFVYTKRMQRWRSYLRETPISSEQ
jgi:hypothetical protein